MGNLGLMRIRNRRLLRFWPVFAAALVWQGRGDVPMPPHKELLELIRAHVVGIPDAELDAAAAGALLEKVRGHLLGPGETGEPVSTEPAIADRKVYDGCAYVRVGQVSLALAPQLSAALQNVDLTNAPGLILDLRFAVGTDYRASANVVNLFVNEETTLLSWGDQLGVSLPKTNAWVRPVTVLVNRETRGAAEALAAALRQQRVGLMIGGRTAGQAAVFEEVPLKDNSGNRLRLAVATVKTGDGQTLPTEGLVPDIEVKSRPEHDRAYLSDPYTIVLAGNSGSTATTNQPITNTITTSFTVVRKRVTEADLVRQKKETDNPAGVETPKETPLPGAPVPAQPGAAARPAASEVAKVIKDPVLGRAIDLLKSLSLFGAKKP